MPRCNSGELEVRRDVEDGGGASAGKRPGKRVRGVFWKLDGAMVQRGRRNRQWGGGNLQRDLARAPASSSSASLAESER